MDRWCWLEDNNRVLLLFGYIHYRNTPPHTLLLPRCPNLCVRRAIILFGMVAPVMVVDIQAVYLTLQKRKQKRVQVRVRIVDIPAKLTNSVISIIVIGNSFKAP